MTSNGVYPEGTYVNKDGEEKVALSARAAVKLVFEGYSLKEASEPEAVEADADDADDADEPSNDLVIPTPSSLFD